MTTFRIYALSLAAAALASALASGCGGDDGGDGSTPPDCGTMEAPDVLQLRDVTPAAGETVQNGAIAHSFTVVDAPGLFQTIAFALESDHTAGSPDPSSVQVSARQEGRDVTYETQPITWEIAPSHVELGVATRYQDSQGCVYAFPSPLFSYEIDAVGAGGGGDGGMGGAGGAGGAGGGG